eukprot:c45064_g1_i1 orf=1-276(-)
MPSLAPLLPLLPLPTTTSILPLPLCLPPALSAPFLLSTHLLSFVRGGVTCGPFTEDSNNCDCHHRYHIHFYMHAGQYSRLPCAIYHNKFWTF